MSTLRDSRGRDPHRNFDTSRHCCDGRCNDNQGRGGCPRVPESMQCPHREPIPSTSQSSSLLSRFSALLRSWIVRGG